MSMPVKLYFVFCCLCCFTLKAYAANITFLLSDQINKPLKVIKPVDGKYFSGASMVYPHDEKNRCSVINDLSRPGILQVYYEKRYIFYLAPGKNYTITLKSNDAGERFVFEGEDHDAQYWLNQLSHPAYQGRAAVYMSKDSTIQGVQKLLQADAEKEHAGLERLQKEGRITNAFYQYGLLETDYYYAAVLAQVIFDSQSKPEFVAEWPKLFAKYSLTADAPLVTMSFQDYADQYANWYKTSYQRKIAGNAKRFDVKKSNAYLIDWYQRYADHLTGQSREVMLASFLSRFSNLKKYEPELVDLFHDFETRYPKSSFIPYIRPGIDEIIAYQVKGNQTLTSVQFLDGYAAIHSLEELLSKLGQKTVYIDIWATWCGPCKEEFAFAADLHQFLHDQKGEILYLSFDIDEREADWQKMITNYSLTGLHVRASQALRNDFISKIWKSKSYAIPRYLIVKNGVIVNADALRPSAQQKLYDQLKAFFN